MTTQQTPLGGIGVEEAAERILAAFRDGLAPTVRRAEGGVSPGWRTYEPDVSHLPPECLTNAQLCDRIERLSTAPEEAR